MIYINDHIADTDVDALLPLLSPQRREQTLKYRFELGRQTCVAAYMLLREALQREYGITEPPVFSYGEHGKPVIVGHPDIHINLSHCKQAAACVVAPHPVGIDVESIGRRSDGVIRYAMNDHEQQLIAQAEEPDIAFARLWTMKEAVAKLSGQGITDHIRDLLKGDEHLRTEVYKKQGYVCSLAYVDDTLMQVPFVFL